MTNIFKRHDKEQGTLVWRLWFILMVELLGTFAMVFEIIAPNALRLEDYAWYRTLFSTFIMKAFWVTAFIWILIMICGKVSVNLNPAVTLSEVAHGKFGMAQASAMILVQVIAALAAGEAAYQIGAAMGVSNVDYNWTLDAVYPRVAVPGWWNIDSISTVLNCSTWTQSWEVVKVLPFMFIEFVFTFLLIASVFKGNFGFMARSFVICVPLTITVAIGVFTNNIALNPARLLGPAIIGFAHSFGSGVHTNSSMDYTWVFLIGELLAVLAFATWCNLENKKEGNTKEAVKKQVRVLSSEVMVTKARYEWVLAGNKALEDSSKAELEYAANFCKVEFNKSETRDDLEYNMLEWIIFGIEENKKPPLVKAKKAEVKKAPAKKAEPKKEVAKKPVAKKAPVKKEEPKISKEEEAKRAALKAKATKAAEGDKLSAAELKKVKLTDLYGVGPKIEAYYHENGITDMVKLSKLNLDTKPKKFIEGLPALKSFKFEDKKDKILTNIHEADFMVKELTK